MLLTSRFAQAADDTQVLEFGYGLGPPTGILVLRYPQVAARRFPEWRDDYVHQFYWSPDGPLVMRRGAHTVFVGPTQVLWAHRGAVHEVLVPDGQQVFRVCLRQVPPALDGLVAGACSITEGAAEQIQRLGRPGVEEAEGLAARVEIMAGLRDASAELPGDATGTGLAARIARELASDPADDTRLEEWAIRLHTSVKTLQRDFVREFGTSFTAWRTSTRLEAAHALLETLTVTEAAHRVGYSTASAFVTAFASHYGYTPGRRTAPVCRSAGVRRRDAPRAPLSATAD